MIKGNKKTSLACTCNANMTSASSTFSNTRLVLSSRDWPSLRSPYEVQSQWGLRNWVYPIADKSVKFNDSRFGPLPGRLALWTCLKVLRFLLAELVLICRCLRMICLPGIECNSKKQCSIVVLSLEKVISRGTERTHLSYGCILLSSTNEFHNRA